MTERPKVGDTFYRYTGIDDAVVFYDKADFVAWIKTLRVTKTTQCGCWIEDDYGTRKFVLNDAVKKYAYPSKREALESFQARRRMWVKILTRNLQRATCELAAVDAIRAGSKVIEELL